MYPRAGAVPFGEAANREYDSQILSGALSFFPTPRSRDNSVRVGEQDANREVRRCFLMPRPPADTRVLIPASVVLQRLHDEVPTDHFTLGWLMDGLHRRSFGVITLLLALVAIAPGGLNRS